MVKRTTTAILMCAVMVLVAAVPMVAADSHDVIKGAKGPRASAVTWEYTPVELGEWTGHIVNDGLRWLVVDVYDVTGGASEQIMHQRIRFAAYDAYPTGTVDTESVVMAVGHEYSITVIPNGPRDSSCTVDDAYRPAIAPVAMFTVDVDYLAVTVDGSGSYDDRSIVSYDWDFGDESSATGMTATHTYAAEGTYTITLVVTDDDGLIGSASEPVTVEGIDNPPVASFTYTVDGLTVSVDASGSSDDKGIVSYDWDWGDGTTGTGMIAEHTYTVTKSTSGAPANAASGDGRAPPPPYYVVGYTYDSGGAILGGCLVTVTNLRTGFSLTNVSNEVSGLYQVDLNPIEGGWVIGDVVGITAVKDTLVGYAEGTTTSGPYLWADVTLHETAVPFVITLTVTDTSGQISTVSQTVKIVP